MQGKLMRVDFEFDKELVAASEYTLADIYETIKREFAASNLPCVSDGEVLSFEGIGEENDWANMWVIIINLTDSEWFMKFATSCIWYNDNNEWEDVLSLAKEKKGIEGWEIQAKKTEKREHIRSVYRDCQELIECYLGSDEEFSSIEDENEKEFYITIRDLMMQQKQRELIKQGVF